jgi:hypothetical protein
MQEKMHESFVIIAISSTQLSFACSLLQIQFSFSSISSLELRLFSLHIEYLPSRISHTKEAAK